MKFRALLFGAVAGIVRRHLPPGQQRRQTGPLRSPRFLAPVDTRTFDLRGKAADAEWEQQASCFRWETDPNWRRRPSILDQMRGWRVTPGVPRKGRIARASLK